MDHAIEEVSRNTENILIEYKWKYNKSYQNLCDVAKRELEGNHINAYIIKHNNSQINTTPMHWHKKGE